MDYSYPNIYPTAPNNEFQKDDVDGGGIPRDRMDYRLSEIARIRDYLERESRERERVYKKYNKAIKVFDTIDLSCTAISIITGTSGTVTLLSIAGSIVSPILLSCSATTSLIGGASKICSRRLLKKARKHDKIKQLADSKFNSVSVLISQALDDGCISQEQFRSIVAELNRYDELKRQIREKAKKTKPEIDGNTKEEWIEIGRSQARKSIMKKIGQ